MRDLALTVRTFGECENERCGGIGDFCKTLRGLCIVGFIGLRQLGKSLDSL